MKHLWEVEHDYVGPDGGYIEQHESWAAFEAFWGDLDMDYNLLFRWDWCLAEDEDETDELYLFFVQQRRARLAAVSVTITAQDEPAVIAWLRPRLAHLQALWEPLTGQEGEA